MSECLCDLFCFCVFALFNVNFGADAAAATSAKNARNLTDIKLCGTWHTPGQSHCCKRHSYSTGHGPWAAYPTCHGTEEQGHATLGACLGACQWYAGAEPFDTKSVDLLISICLIPFRVSRTRITRDPQSAATLNHVLGWGNALCGIKPNAKATLAECHVTGNLK